jgi:organic radical activating enzyme
MAQIIIDEDLGDLRPLIPYVEFYITNVCNLTCTNCNRFNNFNFKGFQKWEEHASDFAQWATHIRLQRVTILGGEPLLNPDIHNWVNGINRTFSKTVQILSNGTRINHVNGLYELLLKQNINKNEPWARNWLGISLHNQNDRAALDAEIRKFLKGTIRIVHKSDPENADNAVTLGGNYVYVDENGVKIPIWEYDEFYNSAVTVDLSGRYQLENSDPEAAHAICGFVSHKCYHFVRGALYKCGPVALFPEFDQQFNFDISESDRVLLNSYRPLKAHEFPDRGAQFLAEIDQVIPQCKFCPSAHTNTKIYAVSKKQNSKSGFE